MPVLAGHRGIGNPWTVTLGIPEESIPAIQYAAAHHADIVEGDASVSGPDANGRRTMFMHHDPDLDRTTNGTGLTNKRPWSYIKTRWLEIPVDINNNNDFDNTDVHPPSFRQWLEAAKATGKRVFVELKGPDWTSTQIKKYTDEVKRQGMVGRVITAGSETKLSHVKSMMVTGKRSWGVSHYPSASKVRSVVGSGYATIRLAEAEANPSYLRALQTAGVDVFLWTLDNANHYKRALPLGAYGWFCDNTNDAWQWLQEHSA